MSSQLDIKKIENNVSSDQYTILILQDISKKLSKLLGLEGKIYAELLSEADEGEYLIFEKTATTNVDILFMRDLLGHYAKGYTLKNNGAVDIQVGHNSDLSKRYSTVSSTSEASFSFNRKKIKSIYVKTNSGTSSYTLTLIW